MKMKEIVICGSAGTIMNQYRHFQYSAEFNRDIIIIQSVSYLIFSNNRVASPKSDFTLQINVCDLLLKSVYSK